MALATVVSSEKKTNKLKYRTSIITLNIDFQLVAIFFLVLGLVALNQTHFPVPGVK